MNFVDLHIHSTASDGTNTPAEDVRLGIEAGLSAMALTDHDTTAGFDEALAELNRIKSENPDIAMELVPGVEISAGYKGRDIHILGLFVDPHNEQLCKELARAIVNRDSRNDKIIARFKELFDITLTHEELCAGNPKTVVTRAHFARVLCEKGLVADKNEAFKKYLNNDAPCYVPRDFMEPEEAIRLIKNAGGVAIIAHPLLYKLSHDEVLELVEKRLIPAGIEGMEVMHSTNKEGDTEMLKAMAEHFGLLKSGGSDYHGKNKPDIKVGVGRGNLAVPYVYYEKIREKSKV